MTQDDRHAHFHAVPPELCHEHMWHFEKGHWPTRRTTHMTDDDRRFMLYAALVGSGKYSTRAGQGPADLSDGQIRADIYHLADSLLCEYEELERVPVPKPPLGDKVDMDAKSWNESLATMLGDSGCLAERVITINTALAGMDRVANRWRYSAGQGSIGEEAATWWNGLTHDEKCKFARWYAMRRFEAQDAPEPPQE